MVNSHQNLLAPGKIRKSGGAFTPLTSPAANHTAPSLISHHPGQIVPEVAFFLTAVIFPEATLPRRRPKEPD
jgi:hypothetical protein